ncbi:Polyhomeotic-like protein 1 [Halotydeus destructor]|nr:Polyhomeotic-like protein 1 [Halotydeus destructor]
MSEPRTSTSSNLIAGSENQSQVTLNTSLAMEANSASMVSGATSQSSQQHQQQQQPQLQQTTQVQMTPSTYMQSSSVNPVLVTSGHGQTLQANGMHMATGLGQQLRMSLPQMQQQPLQVIHSMNGTYQIAPQFYSNQPIMMPQNFSFSNVPFQTPLSFVQNSGMQQMTNATKLPIAVSKGATFSASAIGQNTGILGAKTTVNHSQHLLKPSIMPQSYSTNPNGIVIQNIIPQHTQHPQLLISGSNKTLIDQKTKFVVGGAIQPKTSLMSSSANTSVVNSPLKQAQFAGLNQHQLIAQAQPNMLNQAQILHSYPQLQAWGGHQLSMGQHMFLQTPTSMQTMPMGHQIGLGQVGGTVQVLQSANTPVAGQVVQNVATSTNALRAITTVTQSAQPPLIAPAPVVTTASNTPKLKPLRPANNNNNASTQTAAANKAALNQNKNQETKRPSASPSVAKPSPLPSPAKQIATVTLAAVAIPKPVVEQPKMDQSKIQVHEVHEPRATNSVDQSTQIQKVSTATETRSVAEVPSKPEKNEAPLKPANKSQLAAPDIKQLVAAKPNVQPKLAPRRTVEKRDASTQEADGVNHFVSKKVANGHANNHQAVASPHREPIPEPKPSRKILTHMIGGYVIEESSDPFPISECLGNVPVEENGNSENVNGTSQVNGTAPVVVKPKKSNGDITIRCEKCGKQGPRSLFKIKNGIRRCVPCYKKHAASVKLDLINPVTEKLSDLEFTNSENNSVSSMDIDRCSEASWEAPDKKRMKLCSKKQPEVMMKPVNVIATPPPPPAVLSTPPVSAPSVNPPPAEPANNTTPKIDVYIPAGGKNPLKWNVQDVFDFVFNLPGCREYADEFKSQEIDGQALMLLKEDHLMSAMNMKLGPALKVCSKIRSLQESEG